MAKSSWAPVVFAGAVPRGLNDLLAMTIVGVVGLEASMLPQRFGFLPLGLGALLLVAPLICVLASQADTTRKLREELALLAYGGSSWHLSLRYFLRGVTCTLIGVSPFLYLEYLTANFSVQLTILSASLILTAGGIFYAAPSLSRIHSRNFAENYKG